jgi:hypothetical protein
MIVLRGVGPDWPASILPIPVTPCRVARSRSIARVGLTISPPIVVVVIVTFVAVALVSFAVRVGISDAVLAVESLPAKHRGQGIL